MSIENRLKSIEDETAIRALVARFADACVTADYKAFERLWSEHGRWTIHEPYLLSSKGVDDIVEMMANLRKGRDFFVQFAHSGIITLDGDKASARWLMHEASKGPADAYYNNYGLYIDSLQKSDGQWQFVQRDYHYIWIDTQAFAGTAFALPENPY